MKRVPIGPLRAFDAAARHLNLSAAASELSVTHAAVSRQVKQLEQYLGVKLFERLARGLRLTPHGALLAEGTRAAFERLAEALEDVTAREVRPSVTITTFASLAARWLMPKLSQFHAAHPGVDLRVVTTARLLDFSREDADIGIRFGSGQYPGLHVVPLFQPREFPVCVPALLAGAQPVRRPEDLRHFTLLHDESHAGWTRWLERAGVKNVNPRSGVICGDRNAVLEAALAGQGVGLASSVFVSRELESKRLVRPIELEVPTDYALFAVCLQRRAHEPLLASVLDWLVHEARSLAVSDLPSQ